MFKLGKYEIIPNYANRTLFYKRSKKTYMVNHLLKDITCGNRMLMLLQERFEKIVEAMKEIYELWQLEGFDAVNRMILEIMKKDQDKGWIYTAALFFLLLPAQWKTKISKAIVREFNKFCEEEHLGYKLVRLHNIWLMFEYGNTIPISKLAFAEGVRSITGDRDIDTLIKEISDALKYQNNMGVVAEQDFDASKVVISPRTVFVQLGKMHNVEITKTDDGKLRIAIVDNVTSRLEAVVRWLKSLGAKCTKISDVQYVCVLDDYDANKLSEVALAIAVTTSTDMYPPEAMNRILNSPSPQMALYWKRRLLPRI